MQTARNLEGARQLLHPILGEDKKGPRVLLDHGHVDEALRGGLATGTLHEIQAIDGSGTGFLLGLAERTSASRRLIWIAQDFAVTEHGAIAPTGLVEIGVSPARMILLRAADAIDALRAGLDALTCAALGAVIIEVHGDPKILDLTASRRLMLAAQHKGVSVFLLRTQIHHQPSAAQTRWHVRSAPSREIEEWGRPRFEVTLTRNRQGRTGRWIMEWDNDNRIFRATTDLGAVAAATSNRSSAAQDWLRRTG